MQEKENIKELNNLNKLLDLPKVNKLNLIQKPEKRKVPQIINISNISEEINLEQLKSNKPYKRIKFENLNISKDEKYNDLKDIENKHKKIHNKLNIDDKILLSDNVNLIHETYEMKNIVYKNNLIPKIIPTERLCLKPVPISLKLKLKKHNLLEKPNENNQVQIKNDYLSIKYNPNIKKDNLHLINSNYQLSKINTDKNSQVRKNIIDNEILINKNLINPFLKEEDKFQENHNLIKFTIPKDIKLNIIQKPIKIPKSKIIEIPNEVDEINIEAIKPNNKIKRELNNENINKDIIFEDLDEIKKKNKKKLNKINIKDSLPMDDIDIHIQNTNYEFKNNKNKEQVLIPNIIPHKYEINPIKLSMKLNLEKYNLVEKLKEKKDLKIKTDYHYNNIEYKNLQKKDNLSLLYTDYHLSDINPKEKSKRLLLKECINIIENENIKLNNVFFENTIQNDYNKEKLSFNLYPIIKKSLTQKPEKISKEINEQNEIKEMDEDKSNINDQVKKEINEIDIKNDEANKDRIILKKNLPKKKLIKNKPIDKIDLSENVESQNPNHNLIRAKKNININPNEDQLIKELKSDKNIKNEKDIVNKNLLEDFEKDEDKKPNPNSTEFKFYDSKNNLISSFNFSSFTQNNTNSIEQKQFLNFMHKKFLAFKLFKLKNAHDPKKKWFNIWNKKAKE